MTPRAHIEPPKAGAVRDFINAVLALSDDPEPANVRRYLAASQALEDPRPPRRTKARATNTSNIGHGTVPGHAAAGMRGTFVVR
jgi:hypothetical protein